MTRRLAWCLGTWMLLAAGCGSNDPSAPELWCDGVCAAVARCGFETTNCATTCVQQRPGLASQSVSGSAAERPCLAKLSCQALSDDTVWHDEQKACWDQAIMSVAVTDRVRQLCPDHALALFECGYTLSLDDCEHIYSMWSDAVVDRVALCDAKQTCDELESCEKSVFDNL